MGLIHVLLNKVLLFLKLVSFCFKTLSTFIKSVRATGHSLQHFIKYIVMREEFESLVLEENFKY